MAHVASLQIAGSKDPAICSFMSGSISMCTRRLRSNYVIKQCICCDERLVDHKECDMHGAAL